MRLCLVEDVAAAGLEPLTLTRPVHDLWLGCSTLGCKIAKAFGVGPGPQRRGGVIRSHLVPVQRQRDPHLVVNDRDWLARGPVIVANSRWVPPTGFEPPDFHGPSIGLCDGKPAFALVGPEDAISLDPHGIDSWFEKIAERYTGSEVGGEWMHRPWDLVARNGEHIERGFQEGGQNEVTKRQLATLALVGPSNLLRMHETARIDPYTVFDTTTGPIVVGPKVWVQPFTRVEGPCYIGPETQLFRANIRGSVSIGPNCRIGGEVEATIVHGFSNKYHEGFLGHAYVGEWVNLGAITSNSDLRNDYGEVFVPLQGDPVATGQAKVGCFIGDHTRTGMGIDAQHGDRHRRDVQRPPRRRALAQACPFVHGGSLRTSRHGVLARTDVRHRPDRHGQARQGFHRRRRAALSRPLRADSSGTRAGLPAIPRPPD